MALGTGQQLPQIQGKSSEFLGANDRPTESSPSIWDIVGVSFYNYALNDYEALNVYVSVMSSNGIYVV